MSKNKRKIAADTPSQNITKFLDPRMLHRTDENPDYFDSDAGNYAHNSIPAYNSSGLPLLINNNTGVSSNSQPFTPMAIDRQIRFNSNSGNISIGTIETPRHSIIQT